MTKGRSIREFTDHRTSTTAVSQNQFKILKIWHLNDSSREMQKSLREVLELPIQVTSDSLKRATEDSNLVFARAGVF